MCVSWRVSEFENLIIIENKTKVTNNLLLLRAKTHEGKTKVILINLVETKKRLTVENMLN